MSKSTTTSRGRGKQSSGNTPAKNRSGSRQSSSRENSNTRGNTSRSGNSMSSSGNSASRSGNSGASRSGSSMSSDNRGQSSRSEKMQPTAGRDAGSFRGDSHLEKFFLAQLKDIYYAEKKITQSLPKMRDAATTEELKDAFDDHLHQTERHVRRLEKVFATLGQEVQGEKCEAIEGISREVDNIIGETGKGTLTRDAALIIAAQKVEHYEIATYGGLVQLAITMQLHEAADLLDKTLVEEEDTDELLTEIAENDINLRAEHEGGRRDSKNSSGEEDEDEDENRKY